MISLVEHYEYASRVRRKFFERIGGLPWEEVTKNREASHYGMKDIMLHMIQAEEMLTHYGIYDGSKYQKPREWKEYTDMGMIWEYLDRVEKKTRRYLETADENEMQRKVRLTFPSGSGPFDLSVEEILFQAFTEQVYHLGELIALLWQEDIEPPTMQWFWNNPRTPS